MFRRSFRVLRFVLLAAALLGLMPAAAAAAPAAQPQPPATPPGELRAGVAPTRDHPAPVQGAAPLTGGAAAANMTFHSGGTVMRGPVKVYTIYWQSGTAGYSFPPNFITINNTEAICVRDFF